MRTAAARFLCSCVVTTVATVAACLMEPALLEEAALKAVESTLANACVSRAGHTSAPQINSRAGSYSDQNMLYNVVLIIPNRLQDPQLASTVAATAKLAPLMLDLARRSRRRLRRRAYHCTSRHHGTGHAPVMEIPPLMQVAPCGDVINHLWHPPLGCRRIPRRPLPLMLLAITTMTILGTRLTLADIQLRVETTALRIERIKVQISSRFGSD